jgi:MoaA/NifB/PqqE/SkfB family radical SAM enzyme
LLGVKAVNFELTYKCTSNCPHCLQKNIRLNHFAELTTESIKEAILQGLLSGLCTSGINFTGGEVLGNRDDLFAILRYTQSLGIPFRLNSNSWWSRKKDLKICDMTFSSSIELVKYLKAAGLTQFAFSFDGRLEDSSIMQNLVESIKLCETARVFYQLNFTGINPGEINSNINELRREIGQNLYYLIPVFMEMVDIGGASDLSDEIYSWQSNVSTCENKGFYHPYILHISPGGKVRTCMYAIGLNNVGDLSQESFVNMINNFPNNTNNEIFSNNPKNKEIFKKLVKPYLHLYKPIIHGCTKNVILAKTIELYFGTHDPDLFSIHEAIANELNLTFKAS